MYTLIDNPKTNSLTEAFQSNEIKFAFANYTDKETELQLLMNWVKCREYFNELLMINHHPDEFVFQTIYGFNYEYTKYPLNKEELIVAIKFPSEQTQEQFLANLQHINQIETNNSLDALTTVTPTNVPLVVVVKASKFWQQHCLLLNIYTLLIKLCSLNYPTTSVESLQTYNKLAQKPSEVIYIETIGYTKFNNLLDNLLTIVKLPTKYVDGHDELRQAGTVHAYSGIIYMLTQCKNKFSKKLNELITPKEVAA